VKKNLILLGMMGVGKTTIAKIVSKKLNLKLIDTDLNIEKKLSMKISEIFLRKGEFFFRSEEEKEVLDSINKTNCIIALGGGAFLNKLVREKILKNSISIWLEINLKTLNKRIKWNKKRPLLKVENIQEKINKLYAERKKIYKLAKHRINCTDSDKKNIAKKIIDIYDKQ